MMLLYHGADLSGVSLPVTRPTGRAIVVGQPACRAAPLAILQRMGFTCTEADDPYEAMVHLCRRPLFFSTVILSLNSLFREELSMIASLKHRFSHVEVWLADTDGRQACAGRGDAPWRGWPGCARWLSSPGFGGAGGSATDPRDISTSAA